MRQILTSPTPTRCWAQTQLSLISIFGWDVVHIWAISTFHQVSELKLIWESHYSQVVGNFNMEKTVEVLQRHFYYQNFDKMSTSISSPALPALLSNRTTKKQGLYTPLPTLDRPWESISMDYMSGLSSTKWGNDCVFVVVDRFSKMVILATCKKSITVEATSKLFFERVWVHFGIPQTIILDQDNWFLNTF
jgi:hypothetical protein